MQNARKHGNKVQEQQDSRRERGSDKERKILFADDLVVGRESS